MEGMGRKVRYADVMSTVAVFLALCGGAWAVQSQSSATRTIRACVSKKSGSVRVLAAGVVGHKDLLVVVELRSTSVMGRPPLSISSRIPQCPFSVMRHVTSLHPKVL